MRKTALEVASSFMAWTIGFCLHIFVEIMPGPGNPLQSDFAASGPENYSGLSGEGDRGGGYPLDGYFAWKVKRLELPIEIFSLWGMHRLKCRPIPSLLG